MSFRLCVSCGNKLSSLKKTSLFLIVSQFVQNRMWTNWQGKIPNFLMCLGICSLFFSFGFAEDSIEVALEKYGAAERTEVRSEKEELFNDALKIFLGFAKKNPSGKLFYNIGNTYFYLGDYGLAIAYYRKAEQLIPRDPLLRKNLAQAIDQADVHGYQIERPFEKIVCFQWCSPAERRLLLLGIAIFCFFIFSLHIWFPFRLFQYVWVGSFALLLLLLFSFLWHQYFSLPDAVVVKASVLHVAETASTGATFVLHPGEMVEVISVDPEKSWVRVKTSASMTGYLSGDTVYVIDNQF
jgi:hypothetical protein